MPSAVLASTPGPNLVTDASLYPLPPTPHNSLRLCPMFLPLRPSALLLLDSPSELVGAFCLQVSSLILKALRSQEVKGSLAGLARVEGHTERSLPDIHSDESERDTHPLWCRDTCPPPGGPPFCGQYLPLCPFPTASPASQQEKKPSFLATNLGSSLASHSQYRVGQLCIQQACLSAPSWPPLRRQDALLRKPCSPEHKI